MAERAENMARTAYAVQQDLAMCSGLGSKIIWDSLAPDQAYVLESKLKDLIPDNRKQRPDELARRRKQVFDNVWNQRIYTNRTLLSAIIFVLVTDEGDPDLALKSTNYSCHPVIRTRKCVRTAGSSSSEGCCMIFIDEEGRVYGNWEQYVKKNVLPKGTMISPYQGVYTLSNNNNEVRLTVQLTPAACLKQNVLNISDKLATIGSLTATAILVSPVAGPILLGASMLGASAAMYSTVRSATQLIDRGQHGLATSPMNREARSSWLGLAGGVASLNTTVACRSANFIRRPAAGVAMRGICLSSAVISATGVLNGVYDIYMKISDDQPLDSYTLMQLASSLLIFTHSINNMRLVAKVTNGLSLRNELSRQCRKKFSQIVRESTGYTGDTTDTMRLINDIPYKEAWGSMVNICRNMSACRNKFPSFVQLSDDSQLHVDMDKLVRQLGSKFVRHIGSIDSFEAVIGGLIRNFTKQAADYLLDLTRIIIDGFVDEIDRSLKTFVPTESVLYRILKHCINNYKNRALGYLKKYRREIIDRIVNDFKSLQPQPQRQTGMSKCTTCHGVYYMCSL